MFFFSFERVSKDMDIVDFTGGILFMVLFSTHRSVLIYESVDGICSKTLPEYFKDV